MQPRAEEIYRVLSKHLGGAAPGGSRRRRISLQVNGLKPMAADIRDLRDRCAMVDIESSIFTLAFTDILGLDPLPASEGGLLVTVRPGCFASHAAARLRRNPHRYGAQESGRPLARPSSEKERSERIRRANEMAIFGTDGGIVDDDPAQSTGAEQEIAGVDALRRR